MQAGNRSAQLVFERIYTPDLVEVTRVVDEAAHDGFGSTGMRA